MTQPPCPHPSLGSWGRCGRRINGVVAWAGRRLQATPAGRSVPATSFLPPMARSGGATALAPAPRAPPQRPSWGLVQVRLGGGTVGNEDPSSRLNPCPPGSGEGIWDPLVTLVQAGTGWTLNNNGGLFVRAGESPSGGAQPGCRGTPMPASLSGHCLSCETRACPAPGCPAGSPWEPEGLAGRRQEVLRARAGSKECELCAGAACAPS